MLVGMLCGGVLWPLLTAFVVWVDDADLAHGPLMVIIVPLGVLWTFLGMPHAMLRPGYLGAALVVVIWAAVGAMLGGGWHDRQARKRSG